MKTIALFGAGQVGAMVSRLIAPDWEAVCFADNSADKRGSLLHGIPVLSPGEAAAMKPDAFCLCVTDRGRAGEMERQLRALGYEGEIFTAAPLALFDARAAALRQLSEQINALGVTGDAAELGSYRGDFAAVINAAFPERRLHIFDTFEGFAEADVAVERSEGLSRAKAGDFSATGVEAVMSRLPHPGLAVFHKGWFPDTFRGCEGLRFAFVSVDADLYAPTAAALPLFWDRLSPGGAILVHDAGGTQYLGPARALREFCAPRRILPTPLSDLHGTVLLRKPLE